MSVDVEVREYPVLHTFEWYDPDGTMHTWQHVATEAPSDEDMAHLEAAMERCGVNDAIADQIAKGYPPSVARERVLLWLACELVKRDLDEKAYRRECDRRGLLAL